jgi:type IV secretory pathway TrbL component
MKLKFIFTLLLGCAFWLGVSAQTQSDNSGIKQDTKDAAHSTAKATKKTGKKIKHGTKKAVHKGAHATSKGAGKVEDKTAPTPKPTPQI